MDSSPQNKKYVIIYSPSSYSKPVWVSFFCWTQFWRVVITKQLMVRIDFCSMEKIVNTINLFFPKNIFFCVQQKKKMYTGYILLSRFGISMIFLMFLKDVSLSLWQFFLICDTFSRILWWIDNSKEQHLFETWIFWNIINNFTVTWSIWSLYNKCI